MKTRISFIFIALALSFAGINPAAAQGTAFTYQGRLNASGVPANGLYDFRFRLDADVQGNTVLATVLTNAIPVANGLFITTLDFGAGYLNGSNYWLEVDVKTNAAATYTTLAPLQPLTPTPYAVFAETASNVSGTISASQLSGTVPLAQIPAGVVTNNDPSVTLSNMTVSGHLTLPATGATIFAGANPLLYQDGAYDFYAGVNAGLVPAPVGAGYSTAFGDQSYGNGSGVENTAVGYSALFSSSGGANTAIGSQALSGNGVGMNNTAEGQLALHTSTGNFNTANGASALSGNLGGSYNTASGATALENNRNGNYNTADGYQALYSGFGNPNGSYNTADGYQALYNSTAGNNNTAIGVTALNLLTAGNYNIALGSGAGSVLTTGSSNIDIGNPGVAGDVNVMRLGSSQGQTYLAGVINGNGGGLTNLNAGQLNGSFPASQLSGTLSLAQIPGGVVTNNEPIVSLGALFVTAFTLTGSLNLPAPATITSGFTTVMSFDANHNLGLGGATPQQTLSLNGGMNIDESGLNTGTTANALTFGSTSGEGIGSVRTSGSSDSFGLNFYTDSSKRLTILRNGNVGIGETAPVAQLDVTNSAGSGTAINGIAASGIGISGTTTSGTGVQGMSIGGTGINATSVTGTGLQAFSATGAAVNIASGALKVQGAGVNTATTAFIQVATAANAYTVNVPVIGNVTLGTYVMNPICDGNPNAILIVTHNITACTSTAGASFGDPVGVQYDGNTGHWFIADQNTGDNGSMPLGTAFNVLVMVP